MLLHDLASKTNPKLVRTHGTSHGWPWTHLTHHGLDSGESHHLPPYNILCITPREPHLNDIFSRDSQGGVLKLSLVGLPRLWTHVSPSSNLQLQWGLNQSFNSPRELSSALSHFYWRRWEEVDSRLLVAGSKTTNLTLGPSFAHNLAVDVQMAHARPFLTSTLQYLSIDIKNTSMQGVLAPTIELWIFGSPGGLQVSTFGSVSFILTLSSKWVCDTLPH